MPLILGTNSIKDTGYDVANSLRFNSGSSDNLQKTPSGDGNKTTFSVSTWVKRSKLTAAHESIWSAGQYQSTAMVQVFFESDDTIHVSQFNAGGGQQARLTTNRLFRDFLAIEKTIERGEGFYTGLITPQKLATATSQVFKREKLFGKSDLGELSRAVSYTHLTLPTKA